METTSRLSQSTTATRSSHQIEAFVPFPPNLQPVRLIRRRNRFTVDVCRGDEGVEVSLHLPNSGRMTELLQPGTLGLAQVDREGEAGRAVAKDGESWKDREADKDGETGKAGKDWEVGKAGKAEKAEKDGRKTAGTLLLVQYQGRWVSVDARMPNRLLARCLETGALPPFRGYSTWKAEVSWGKSRVDFLLSSSGGSSQNDSSPDNSVPGKPAFLVETKSCNLVEEGLALFPDAPTTRGARHLRELAEAVDVGYRAAVVWFVQRDDARAFAPHAKADPDFARAFRDARAKGVEAYAYRCLVEPIGITVLDEIPIVM